MNIKYWTPAMLLAEQEQQLSRLRRAIAKSETLADETRLLALGVAEADAALGGGLTCGALHELSASTLHCGAAAGFAIQRGDGLPAYRAMQGSQDAGEGARAFAEHRAPRWQGR